MNKSTQDIGTFMFLQNSQQQTKNFYLNVGARVVNGPTGLGPNPKTNLKPKSCPKKPKVKSENLTMLPSYFDCIFVHLRQKVRFSPEIFVKFRSEPQPDPKSPARLTTLVGARPSVKRLIFVALTTSSRYVTLYCNSAW